MLSYLDRFLRPEIFTLGISREKREPASYLRRVADREGKRDFSERIQGINGYYIGGQNGNAPRRSPAWQKPAAKLMFAELGISFPPETRRGCVPLAASAVVNLFVMCIKFWPSPRTHATWSNCLAKLLYRTVKELPSTSFSFFGLCPNKRFYHNSDVKIINTIAAGDFSA